MKRVLFGAVAALLFLPTLARAVPRQLPADPQATVHRGELITPRSFEFASLPPVSSLPYAGPQTEVHDEGIWSVAEEDLRRQKAHPELLPDLANLGAHLTLDPTPRPGGSPRSRPRWATVSKASRKGRTSPASRPSRRVR